MVAGCGGGEPDAGDVPVFEGALALGNFSDGRFVPFPEAPNSERHIAVVLRGFQGADMVTHIAQVDASYEGDSVRYAWRVCLDDGSWCSREQGDDVPWVETDVSPTLMLAAFTVLPFWSPNDHGSLLATISFEVVGTERSDVVQLPVILAADES